jgi:glycosyltransferase involved in cell wall biosynthesis
MLKLTDITFHANHEYANTTDLLKAQFSSLLYVSHLKKWMTVEVIKHVAGTETVIDPHENYQFFVSKNRHGYISPATIAHLKKTKPDIVLVRGLIFPLHILRLKMLLGKQVKIIVRHHADTPSKGIKKYFQMLADRVIDAYLFTSYGNAKYWIGNKIISSTAKLYEMPGTLTGFEKKDKLTSRQKLGLAKGPQYIWVGRLNANKDPLTVLKAFEHFLLISPEAKLHLFYQTEELLPEILKFKHNNSSLTNAIVFHGPIKNEDLVYWYSAADFYISASYSEGGSAALLEAMSCGCIPIVSAIPAAMKVTENGKYGFHFQPGDADELLNALTVSLAATGTDLPLQIESHFQKEFSVAAVSEKLYRICIQLAGK